MSVMRAPLVLFLLFITVAIMGVVHYLALELHLYWQYPWLDNPMHILGGIAVAFTLLSLPTLGVPFPSRYRTLYPVLAGVLIVGLLWELFEIWIDIPLFEPDFEKDVVKDLIMDLVGGALGYAIGSRINTLEYD